MIKTRFKFRPVAILKGFSGPCRGESLGAWQWFVRKLMEVHMKADWHRPPYEFINGTSSINNNAPHKIGGVEYYRESNRRMVDILLRAGDEGERGRFLKQIGIASWADLEKPIFATVETSDQFPNPGWFRMAGRTFRKSPNSCHSDATSVHQIQLRLKWDAKLWAVSIEYGYPHDSSSWYEDIWQNEGERLDAFSARVDARIEWLMTPDLEPYRREFREREWQANHRALKDIFTDRHFDMPEWESELCDAIGAFKGSRITLTRARLVTLKKWART